MCLLLSLFDRWLEKCGMHCNAGDRVCSPRRGGRKGFWEILFIGKRVPPWSTLRNTQTSGRGRPGGVLHRCKTRISGLTARNLLAAVSRRFSATAFRNECSYSIFETSGHSTRKLKSATQKIHLHLVVGNNNLSAIYFKHYIYVEDRWRIYPVRCISYESNEIPVAIKLNCTQDFVGVWVRCAFLWDDNFAPPCILIIMIASSFRALFSIEASHTWATLMRSAIEHRDASTYASITIAICFA